VSGEMSETDMGKTSRDMETFELLKEEGKEDPYCLN